MAPSALAGAGGIGLAFGLREHFPIFRGEKAFIGIVGVLLVHQILSKIVVWLETRLKDLCKSEKDQWALWYKDLKGGVENVDIILKSVVGTLIGAWIAHLLKNDYHITPIFYLTTPLWFYILVIHLTQRTGSEEDQDNAT